MQKNEEIKDIHANGQFDLIRAVYTIASAVTI